MVRSARGILEEPGSHVAQKAGLNREILAAAWGGLIRMVAYKAEEAGRELILVNPGTRASAARPAGIRRPPTGPPRQPSPAGPAAWSCTRIATQHATFSGSGRACAVKSAKRRPARHDRAGYFLAGP